MAILDSSLKHMLVGEYEGDEGFAEPGPVVGDYEHGDDSYWLLPPRYTEHTEFPPTNLGPGESEREVYNDFYENDGIPPGPFEGQNGRGTSPLPAPSLTLPATTPSTPAPATAIAPDPQPAQGSGSAPPSAMTAAAAAESTEKVATEQSSGAQTTAASCFRQGPGATATMAASAIVGAIFL